MLIGFEVAFQSVTKAGLQLVHNHLVPAQDLWLLLLGDALEQLAIVVLFAQGEYLTVV